MCTVSVIPAGGGRGLRLMMNRDERRTRMAAWPPRVTTIGGIDVCAPTDAEALGTWVAAADTGLAWAVMNIHPPAELMPRATTASRGDVIPALVTAAGLDEAAARFRSLPLAACPPVRVIVAGDEGLAVLEWDGRHRRTRRERLTGPWLFSSSSLGDALVEAPRRALFEALLASEADAWRAQDRLHVHAWPDRRHLSVLMSRATACTVSRTTVVTGDSRVEMSYAPMVDGWPGPVSRASVARAGARLAVPA